MSNLCLSCHLAPLCRKRFSLWFSCNTKGGRLASLGRGRRGTVEAHDEAAGIEKGSEEFKVSAARLMAIGDNATGRAGSRYGRGSNAAII